MFIRYGIPFIWMKENIKQKRKSVDLQNMLHVKSTFQMNNVLMWIPFKGTLIHLLAVHEGNLIEWILGQKKSSKIVFKIFSNYYVR